MPSSTDLKAAGAFWTNLQGHVAGNRTSQCVALTLLFRSSGSKVKE